MPDVFVRASKMNLVTTSSSRCCRQRHRLTTAAVVVWRARMYDKGAEHEAEQKRVDDDGMV